MEAARYRLRLTAIALKEGFSLQTRRILGQEYDSFMSLQYRELEAEITAR